MGGHLEIGLLGPVEVRFGGDPVDVPGARQRALLADLAMHPGRVVSTSQLIDDLWGDDPPASAAHAVEAAVSRVRSALRPVGAHDRLVTRAPGYALEIPADQVDVHRFEAMTERATTQLAAGDAASASSGLRDALDLWRGAALADLDGVPVVRTIGQRLEGTRLRALERRIDADLQLGRHGDVLHELEALVPAHPFHERFHEQLMLACYRSGRQADALAAYRRARETLVDELGVEPRPQLQRLQDAILRHDPELELATSRSTEGGRPDAASVAPRPRRRRRLAVGLAAAVALAIVAAAVPRLVGSDDRARTLPRNAIGAIDPVDGSVVWSTSLPEALGELVQAGDSVWGTSAGGSTLYRFEPASGEVLDEVDVGPGTGALAVGGGAVWVGNAFDGTVSRVDIGTGHEVQRIDIGSTPTGLTYEGGTLWVAEQAEGTLSRVDAETGAIDDVFSLRSPPTRAAIADGSLWVTSRTSNSLLRLDREGGEVVQVVSVGAGPDGIVSAFGKLWIANALDSTVSVVDPETGVVLSTIPVGLGPSDLAVGDGAIWVTGRDVGRLVRIHATDDRVTATIRVGDRPDAVAVVEGRPWVATGVAPGPAHRGGTLRLLYAEAPPSIDPALVYPTLVPFMQPAYDTLVSFEHVGGAPGIQLVPDLALTIPMPEPDGLTYTFQIRDGVRYSDGSFVQPADFRYGLERALAMNPATVPFFTDLVGASACTRRPPACDLSEAIVVDDVARTVAFRLERPDPAFLFKLTLPFVAPVPPSVPRTDTGNDPVPSTGPYQVVRSQLPEWVELARNPWFRSWSIAARPDGFVDRIVWRFGLSVDEEIDLILAGEADWMYDQPGERAAELATQYPEEVRSSPLQNTDYAFLNTRVPPFDDVRVRRAVNLAVDRAAVAGLFGGSIGAVPTCQVLPPTMPGYAPYCPYTVNPNPDGAWIGPDLEEARHLIEASGTEGMRITYWSLPDEPFGAGIGRYLVDLLDRLGYRATLRILPYREWAPAINDSRNGAQMGTGGWIADYPAASNFLEFFLKCSSFVPADPDSTSNSAEFCHPGIDRQMDRADRLQLIDPERANDLWARVDRRVVDLAPWIALVNERWIDLLSERIGNFQFNPVYGVLLDLLWVR